MRFGDVLVASGLAVAFFALLGLAEPAPQNSGVSQMRQLGRGISLYAADANGTCPMSMVLDEAGAQWLGNLSIEAPAGLMRDTSPGRTEGFRSCWVNSVVPYWPSVSILKIEGAPTAPPRLKLEDTIKDPWLIGFNYNGLLHAYRTAAIAHPELVPLIWTGQGLGNREGRAQTMPNLSCFLVGPKEPCLFNSQATVGLMRSMMFMQVGPARVFDGGMLFAMGDGSVKHITPDPQMNMASEDPWGMYDSRGYGMSYKTDGAYPPLFRPDRAPK